VAGEALGRGHTLTVVARDLTRLRIQHPPLAMVTADATDVAGIVEAVRGHDAVAAAIGGRREKNHGVVPAAARAMLSALPKAGVKRLVWVGGAGSLEVASGARLIDTPSFPAEWKEEALAQVEALEIFRSDTGEVEWTFLSPAALLEPGPRTGQYRTGADQLVVNKEGASRISVEDFAVAFVDELERAEHVRQRFTVAY